MLPSRRAAHSTMYTAGILSNFPAWMKLRDPSSKGFKLVDAILGNELELFASTLRMYAKYPRITDSPINTFSFLSQIEIPYFIKDKIIYTDDNTPIYVVEKEHEFLTNSPTRINGLPDDVIYPSGLNGNDIVGLEWLDAYPSGTLVVKTNASDITPSSILYYDINTTIGQVNLIPVSGQSLGIAYVGLGENNSFDSNYDLESEWSIRVKYPAGIWITPSGESKTKPSGYLEYENYIDLETGEKIYRQKMFNNPYGSGVFNKSDLPLDYTPISGTIKVTDPYNLISGLPAVIPSTGLPYYTYVDTFQIYDSETGLISDANDTWIYKGYEEYIPWDITPREIQQKRIDAVPSLSGVPISGTYVATVSWEQLREGGYVDNEVYPNSGTFNYIDGTGDLINKIRFTNAFSRYRIEYAYEVFNNITQISTDGKDAYKPASNDKGTLYFISGADFYESLVTETSASKSTAVRFDPYMVRPGAVLYYTLRTNTKKDDVWMNSNTTDKTIQFYNHNIGYTDELGIRNV